MPWNGSGVFSRIYSWVASRDAGLDILADRMDQDTDDIAQGLMHCLTVNGETTPAANLPMANFRHTGASAGVADTDYATVGQVKNGGGGIAAGGFVPISGGAMTGNLTVPFLRSTGNLQADGEIFGGSLHCYGAAEVDGNLNVLTGYVQTRNLVASTTISALGAATVGSLHSTGSADIDTTLNVDGTSTLRGQVTLTNGVAGNLAVGGAATIGGATTVGSLHATGSADIDATLNVDGTSTLRGQVTLMNGVAGNLAVANNLTVQGSITAVANGFFDNDLTCQGTITAVSDVWASTVYAFTFTNRSDPRLKADIAPAPAGCLELVEAVLPRTYHWRDKPDTAQHWGFLAPEIGAAMAARGWEFGGVATDRDGFAGLAYAELVPVLWKAVQELAARVAALEAR